MSQRNDFAKIAARNSLTVILCCLLGAAIGLYLSFVIPKRFKSQAKIQIQASYFQNPLVDNLVAPVTDPAELQGQRTALIQRALSDDLLTRLGEGISAAPTSPPLLKRIFLKLGLSEPSTPELQKAEMVESIRDKIAFFPESSTSFILSFSAGSPATAQAITTQMVDEVQRLLFDERKDALTNTKESLERRAKSLGAMLENTAEPEMQAAVKQTQAELSGLLLRFSPLHPRVVAEKGKLDKLQRQLPSGSKGGGEALTNAEQAPTKMVFEDLVKKLNYLSVVLDMESAKSNKGYVKIVEPPTFPTEATFPKKSLFFLFGSVAGLLLGSMISFVLEQLRRNLITADEASLQLGAPLLSELPPLRIGSDAFEDHSRLPAGELPKLPLP